MGSRLAPIIRFIVAAEEVTDRNPHPEGYLQGLRHLGLARGNVVAVEDSLAGIESAHPARLRVIAVEHSYPGAALLDVAADEVVLHIADVTWALLAGVILAAVTPSRVSVAERAGHR